MSLHDPSITPIRSLAGAVIAVLLCALAVAVTSADAAGKTETLRIFSKVQSFTYTAADGTVTKGPPTAPPQAGDSFEIDSLDYRGNHKKHSKKPIGADYLQLHVRLRPRARTASATPRSATRCCASTASTSSAPSGAGRTPRS